MTRALALVDDLLFLSRIREAAAGGEVRSVRGAGALLEACRAGAPALVILDLDADRLGPLEALAALRADPSLAGLPSVGFVSHVNGERAQAAQRAGCTRVLARSAFVLALPGLLREPPQR